MSQDSVGGVTLVRIASSIGVCEVDMVDSGRRSADCTVLRSINEGLANAGYKSSAGEICCEVLYNYML